MVAELYIVAESFANNANFSTNEIEDKTKALAQDFVYIRKYKEANKLYVHPDIYNINFLNGIVLSDLVYNWQVAKQHIDRDVFNALQKIVVESATTTYTSEEVIEILLLEHNEDCCHAVVAFNAISNIQPERQIVYNLQGWFEFRRHFLSIYPGDAAFFMEECRKYFPNIIFHENNWNTVGAILPNFSAKIIYHLVALHDRFSESLDGIRNRQQILDHFSINCKLDETASLQGNANANPFFTYEFHSLTGAARNVCCAPHLKLCSSGIPGDNTYYFHRIYFHEGLPDFEEGKLLVGHIGEHINFN
jgi:hypothetical protein